MAPTTLSRTSTPARAITSPLSARSSPPIPPATQLFEPLVKAVLRHRLLYNIFGYSLLFSWIQTVIWVIWCAGGVGELGIGGTLATPVMPTTLLLAGFNWAIVPLPVIVFRKKYLTGMRLSHQQPSLSKFDHSTSFPYFGVFTRQNPPKCSLEN